MANGVFYPDLPAIRDTNTLISPFGHAVQDGGRFLGNLRRSQVLLQFFDLFL